jgi:hypothetical protein
MTCEIYCFPKIAGSTYSFGLSTSTKRQGHMLSPKMNGHVDSPWSGRSAMVAQTVRGCAESVRVSDF